MKLIIIALIFLFLADVTGAFFTVDLESGMIISGYNNIRIPNKTGSLISLSKELKTDRELFWRVRAGYTIRERHFISVFAAPLTLNAKGSVERDIFFFEKNFAAGEEITAKFRFDSYRLTYCYTFLKREKLNLGIGLTAKIRDAEITLSNKYGSSTKLNTGFVPIIHFNLEWLFSRRCSLVLNGDALASPGGQGRAEDIFAGLLININEKMSAKLGYRVLEGGADVDEVYNFTLVHYLAAGVLFRL